MAAPNSPSPRTEKHKDLTRSILSNSITLVEGPAGSGKTYGAISTFLDLLSKQEIRKIVIVRLISDTFDEKLGALPGAKEEKLFPFFGPVLDNLLKMRTKSQINYMLDKGIIEVIPVSHVRGRTFTDCAVLVDEVQNFSPAMVLACLTRIGERSKMVLAGDPIQNDFSMKREAGTSYAYRLLSDLEDVGVVEFTEEHILRHPIIKQILLKHKSLNL